VQPCSWRKLRSHAPRNRRWQPDRTGCLQNLPCSSIFPCIKATNRPGPCSAPQPASQVRVGRSTPLAQQSGATSFPRGNRGSAAPPLLKQQAESATEQTSARVRRFCGLARAPGTSRRAGVAPLPR
jgi:hypothetical protein